VSRVIDLRTDIVILLADAQRTGGWSASRDGGTRSGTRIARMRGRELSRVTKRPEFTDGFHAQVVRSPYACDRPIRSRLKTGRRQEPS
jgi:hypothetical protein